MLTEIIGSVVVVSATSLAHFVAPRSRDWLRQLTREGVIISGDWSIVHVGEPLDGKGLEECWTFSAHLRQMGQKVAGEAKAVHCDEGKIVTYKVKGNLVNGFLDCIFTDKDKNRLNRTVFLAAIDNDGQSISGYKTFIGRERNEPRVVKCAWSREGGWAANCNKS